MYMLNFLIHYTALYHIVSELENIFEKTSALQDRENTAALYGKRSATASGRQENVSFLRKVFQNSSQPVFADSKALFPKVRCQGTTPHILLRQELQDADA